MQLTFSVQLVDQGAGGHSGTQRYETRGSGSKLADWSVKALCERGARCWSKCAFIDAWPCTVHAVDFQCIHTSSITLSLLPGVRVTYFCACLNVRGARAWAKYPLNRWVHDQCAVSPRCRWTFGHAEIWNTRVWKQARWLKCESTLWAWRTMLVEVCIYWRVTMHCACSWLSVHPHIIHYTQLASRRACYIFLCVLERAWSTGMG